VRDRRAFLDRLASRAALAGVVLEASQADLLATYVELLTRWNRRINLTALSLMPLQDSTLDRLLVEPLAAAAHVPASQLCWVDIGSGGGSPAIPLKVVRPAAHLTMIEARGKKSAFLSEAVRVLGLRDAKVWTGRAEEFEPAEGGVELITVRAVAVAHELLALAHRWLVPGGRLLVFGSSGPRFAALFTDSQTVKLLPDPSSQLTIFRR